MDRWRQAALLARFVLLCAALWVVLDGLPYILAWRQRIMAPAPTPKPRPAAGLGIPVFRLTPTAIGPGASATLCYEVTGAAAFTLDPLPAGFAGAPKACLPVSPSSTTRYTLTASDVHRSRVSRSIVLQVQPAAR